MQRGFTLIELLVVLVIIGILTATMVPQFNSYKARAFDTRAESDLRNVAIAEEAYFLDTESYLSCANEGCSELPGISKLSDGVALSITTEETDFVGEASHPRGTGKIYRWSSSAGGLVEAS